MWLRQILGGSHNPEEGGTRVTQPAQQQPDLKRSGQDLRGALLSSLGDVHAACDLVMGSASVSELTVRIAGTPTLLQALDSFRPDGAASLLHALQLPRWLESGGRVSLAALQQSALDG